MKVLGYIFVASLCFTLSFTQDDIRKPPSITKDPTTEVIFRENDAVTLTCKAEGIPAVTYVWKKNGEELNLNHTNIHRGSDGDITIVEATRSDDGFYKCFATNQYGTALSTVAHIQQAFLHRTSQSNIVDMTVQEGHPFVIQAPQRNSFPPPTYNWEITTSTVDTNPRTYGQSQRVRSANNGDLHFVYALKQDELGGSIYKNTAFNPNIDVRSGGTYTRVIVTQGSGPPPDFPPSITYFKSQEVAVIGGSIELECFFSGKPLPEITWSLPRNNLPSGRSSISQHETRLMISNLVESDEGDYVCIANNTLGTINNTFNIRVEAKPVFKKEYDGPRNVNVTEGESVTFNCSAFANPEATVVWLRNGQPIDVNNVSQRFAFSNDNKTLTISEVCRDCVNQERKTDLMVIQCLAGNVHGFAFASGYLNVLLMTKVTLQPNSTFVLVDLTKENRFQFVCSAASDPSTQPTVRWYKVKGQGQEVVYNESSYVYVMDGNLTIYTEPNCSTTCNKYLGEYRCVGDNGYNRDFATVILNGSIAAPKFIRKSDGPRNVTVKEGDSVTFNCFAFAKPEATVVWLQNGQPIDVNNAPKRVLFSSDSRSLTIRDVCRECVDRERKTDLMVIQCNASNVYGYAFGQGYLNVLMKTRVTIRGPKSVSVYFLEEKQFVFQCYVTSDPSTPPTVGWYKTEPYGGLVRDEPPYIDVENDFLIIMFYPNCSSECSKYLGEYRCIGDNGYSRENRTITLSYKLKPPPAPPTCEVATYIPWWLIFILMLLGVLLFLVGICVGRCGKRSNENRVDFDTNQDPTVYMNTSDKLNENARDDDTNLKPVGSSASPLIDNTYM